MVILLAGTGVVLMLFGGWQWIDSIRIMYAEGYSITQNAWLMIGCVSVLAGLLCLDIARP